MTQETVLIFVILFYFEAYILEEMKCNFQKTNVN